MKPLGQKGLNHYEIALKKGRVHVICLLTSILSPCTKRQKPKVTARQSTHISPNQGALLSLHGRTRYLLVYFFLITLLIY